MIINLRGTSGAGKSYLVRHIMTMFSITEEVFCRGRKQPLYYILRNKDEGRDLAVLGHYNTPCGGCDTISKTQDVFDLVMKNHNAGRDVLFEGVIIGYETKRTKDLPDLRIVFLTTNTDICVDSINERRRARGQMEPVNPKNTIAKHRQCVGARIKFLEMGNIQVFSANRNDASVLVEEMLGL